MIRGFYWDPGLVGLEALLLTLPALLRRSVAEHPGFVGVIPPSEHNANNSAFDKWSTARTVERAAKSIT